MSARWVLGAALLAVSVASGCAPEYQGPPEPLVPLVEPSAELTQPTLSVSTTTTVPAPTTTVLQLQPTPTLYAPGTEVESGLLLALLAGWVLGLTLLVAWAWGNLGQNEVPLPPAKPKLTLVKDEEEPNT